jgi:hypothetical protein
MDLEKYLERLDFEHGIIIKNESTDNYILFNVNHRVNIGFGMTIWFSGITNQEEFRINIPALNIKAEQVSGFADKVREITDIIFKLNKYLEEYKKNRLS